MNVRASRAVTATAAAGRRPFAARLTRVRLPETLPAPRVRGGVTTVRGVTARGRLVAPARGLGPLRAVPPRPLARHGSTSHRSPATRGCAVSPSRGSRTGRRAGLPADHDDDAATAAVRPVGSPCSAAAARPRACAAAAASASASAATRRGWTDDCAQALAGPGRSRAHASGGHHEPRHDRRRRARVQRLRHRRAGGAHPRRPLRLVVRAR